MPDAPVHFVPYKGGQSTRTPGGSTRRTAPSRSVNQDVSREWYLAVHQGLTDATMRNVMRNSLVTEVEQMRNFWATAKAGQARLHASEMQELETKQELLSDVVRGIDEMRVNGIQETVLQSTAMRLSEWLRQDKEGHSDFATFENSARTRVRTGIRSVRSHVARQPYQITAAETRPGPPGPANPQAPHYPTNPYASGVQGSSRSLAASGASLGPSTSTYRAGLPHDPRDPRPARPSRSSATDVSAHDYSTPVASSSTVSGSRNMPPQVYYPPAGLPTHPRDENYVPSRGSQVRSLPHTTDTAYAATPQAASYAGHNQVATAGQYGGYGYAAGSTDGRYAQTSPTDPYGYSVYPGSTYRDTDEQAAGTSQNYTGNTSSAAGTGTYPQASSSDTQSYSYYQQ